MMLSTALWTKASTLDWLKLLWATWRSPVVRERYATPTPANRTTKASTMISAAPRSGDRSLLTIQPMLPNLQIEVASVNPDPPRCFAWEQLAAVLGLAGLHIDSMTPFHWSS